MSVKRKLSKWLIAILLALATLFACCAIYVSIYYKADEDAVDAFLSSAAVKIEKTRDFTAFIPNEEVKTGLVFYPGGKVDAKAYYPLMYALAERGVLAAVLNVPFRLAVLDVNAASDVTDCYHSIERWFIGGHSLGGAMAASYLSKHASDFDGLVLLGAYSTSDLSALDIAVLSVYGSNDGVMNREKYASNIHNLPTNFTERIIDGGNHAYFGLYGDQKGDGVAAITAENQICTTADFIAAFAAANAVND